MTSLVTQLKQGHIGKIAAFTDEQVAGKLMTMGVLPGSQVRIVRIAPFNGGYYLKVDDASMVLRVKEAGSILLYAPGKSITCTSLPSGRKNLPTFFSTVTPGKLATFCRSPVS